MTGADFDQLQQGFALLQAGRTLQASDLARDLASRANDAPDAWHLLALCAAEHGDFAGADTAFERALQLAPGQALILANLASALRRQAAPDRALVVAKRAVTADPGSVQGWFEMACAAFSLGQHDDAVDAARHHLALRPDSGHGWSVLAMASSAQEDVDSALQAALQWTRLAPDDPAAHACLATIWRKAGQPAHAVRHLESTIAQVGRHAGLLDALAGALVDASQPQQAIQVAATMVRNQPDHIAGIATLARLLAEYADESVHGPNADIRLYHALLDRRQDDLALRQAFAIHLLAVGDPAGALAQLDRLRRHGDRPDWLLLQAQAHDDLCQYALARTLYERLVEDGASPAATAHVRFGVHLLRVGETRQAEGRFAAALRREPDNQEAWAWQATAWRLLQDPREDWLCGYDHLLKSLQIGPPARFEGSMRDFLHELDATLESLHRANCAPAGQSVRRGTQTPGRLFGRDEPAIQELQQAVLHAIEQWLPTMTADHAHPFLRRLGRSVRFGGSWSVKLARSGNHANHFHAEGWMSSAFYVALPADVIDETSSRGAIQFGQPPGTFPVDIPPQRTMTPRVGELLLFPSYLWHGTVPFEDDAPRVTVAFDMVPVH